MNRASIVKIYFAITAGPQKKTALTRARFWPLRLYWQASLGGDAILYVSSNSNIGARLPARIYALYLPGFSFIYKRHAGRGPE
jgi:hypothetical protein